MKITIINDDYELPQLVEVSMNWDEENIMHQKDLTLKKTSFIYRERIYIDNKSLLPEHNSLV